MRRRPKDFISARAVKHVLYLPRIISLVENWYPFLTNYLGLRNTKEVYVFRSGTRIATDEGADSVTIAVVYIKRDYGRIKPNLTVIDIGANIGVFAIYAATTAPGTRVYAYEPMPSTFQLMVENIRRNDLEERIIPAQLGVTAGKERRRLYAGTESQFSSIYPTGDPRTYVDVDCVSLADILEENSIHECDLLKLDCEGAEFEILYNTPSEYLSRIKAIRMEYHNDAAGGERSLKPLLAFLRSHGFGVRKLKEVSERSGNVWLEHVG